MIVALHISKTAGTSFRMQLAGAYGRRMHLDYEDRIGWDSRDTLTLSAQRARCNPEELVRDYDVIYGNFIADKYADLFPVTDFGAFFRDPCQHAVSHYEYLLRQPATDDPMLAAFHAARPTLTDLIELLPDFQTMFLGRVRIEDFSFVGLVEEYERSVALFEVMFGRKLLSTLERSNVNPNRSGESYQIAPEVQRAINLYRPRDVELHRCARERFERLAARYAV